MIKKTTLFIVVCFVSLLSADYVNSKSLTPASARTNAPKEGNCTGCHGGNLNSGTGSISIQFPDTVYKPDSTYTLTATVSDSKMKRFGFQVTALDANDLMMGTLIVTNATNTSTQNGTVAGKTRSYINHKAANTNSTWTFDWKAPSAGNGTISFYMAGNATDGSQTTTGDKVYADTFTWDEFGAPPASVVTITGATEVCEDDTAAFSATVGFNTYLWNTGDTTSSTQYAATSNGMKTIWVIADSGLSSEARDTVMLMVHSTPDAPTIKDTAFGNVIQITNVDAGSTYQWYKNSAKLVDSSRTLLEYSESGDYHVEVTDSNGCTNISNTVSVTANTGVYAVGESMYRVYPNPSNGVITVTSMFGSNIDIININGLLVHSISNYSSDKLKVELSTGMYFLKIQNDKQTLIEKVVIR